MRGRLLALLSVSLVLAAAARGAASETPREELDRAIQLFGNFQDEAAAFTLRHLLGRASPAEIGAKAHIYLALIQLNLADVEGAKAEMQKAVSTDVMVDLPTGQSPKAQVLFAQARRELATAPTPPPATPPTAAPARVAPPPTAPVGEVPVAEKEPSPPPLAPASDAPVAEKETAAPPPATPVQVPEAAQAAPPSSHLPAYLVGAGSVVLFGVGGLFGYLQQQALNDARNPSPGSTVASVQNAANSQYPQDGLIADVLFGAGAAAGVAAIILFATEGFGGASDSGGQAGASVSAGPRGLSLQGAF